jgi:hypothetical protein
MLLMGFTASQTGIIMMMLHRGWRGFPFHCGVYMGSVALLDLLCWRVTLSDILLMYKKDRFPKSCSFDF